jgi:hypothetical protein
MAAPPKETSENCPLEVNFLPVDCLAKVAERNPVWAAVCPTQLGMCPMPGRWVLSLATGAVERNLSADITQLKTIHRVSILTTLVEEHELVAVRAESLFEEADALGIQVFRKSYTHSLTLTHFLTLS